MVFFCPDVVVAVECFAVELPCLLGADLSQALSVSFLFCFVLFFSGLFLFAFVTIVPI